MISDARRVRCEPYVAPIARQLIGGRASHEGVDVAPVSLARGVGRERTATIEQFDAAHVRERQRKATVRVLLAGLSRLPLRMLLGQNRLQVEAQAGVGLVDTEDQESSK